MARRTTTIILATISCCGSGGDGRRSPIRSQLSDGSEVTGMFARTLALECPQGESGKGTITAEDPTQLPEAAQAIRSGKLPRKAGLILVRPRRAVRIDAPGREFRGREREDPGRRRGGRTRDHGGPHREPPRDEGDPRPATASLLCAADWQRVVRRSKTDAQLAESQAEINNVK